MNRDRYLIILSVLYFAILGCFLLGCSEGTDSSPVSALMGEITAEQLQGSSNKVIGLVLYSSNNEAASKELVNLINNNNLQTIKSELTNSDGSFIFTGVPNGSYTLEVKDHNGFTQDLDLSISEVVINNGLTTPDKNYIFLKYNSTNASETFSAEVYGYVKHSDNSAVSSATATLYKKDSRKDSDINQVNVLSDGYFFFTVEEPGNYYVLINDELAKENPTRRDIVVQKSKVSPNPPININIFVKPNEDKVTLEISVISAYTSAPLELATIKINGENQGTSDKNGTLIVKDFPIGVCNIEVSKEGFETLTTTKTYEEKGTASFTLTMIEDTKDGYGSITGRYIDIEGKSNGESYVRLYRLIERTQTSNIGNKSETWYDVDKKFILTTKTSNKNDSSKGSFKLTHIEPGYYQIYIASDTTIPETVQCPQVYNDFEWTQLATDSALVITQPLKVVSDQTTYWTNYEQGNN